MSQTNKTSRYVSADKPCSKCGGTERYIKSEHCVACAQARSKNKYKKKKHSESPSQLTKIARQEASERGDKRFQSFTKCMHCLKTERYVSNGACCFCLKHKRVLNSLLRPERKRAVTDEFTLVKDGRLDIRNAFSLNKSLEEHPWAMLNDNLILPPVKPKFSRDRYHLYHFFRMQKFTQNSDEE